MDMRTGEIIDSIDKVPESEHKYFRQIPQGMIDTLRNMKPSERLNYAEYNKESFPSLNRKERRRLAKQNRTRV